MVAFQGVLVDRGKGGEVQGKKENLDMLLKMLL